VEEISVFIAFSAGILSFLSPCVLPLVPVYASYITGASMDELLGKKIAKSKILTHSLMFIFGFTSVFVAMGAFSGVVGALIVSHIDILSKIAGLLVIILGLHHTDTIKIQNLYHEKRLALNARPKGILGSFLVGLSFAAGWSPCLGPIVGSLLLMAGTSGGMMSGISLLSAFSAGIALPFLALSFGLNIYLTKRHMVMGSLSKVKFWSGVLMVLIGMLMVAGVYQKFAKLVLLGT
jgi:cytochrome c-type biogenesis protein